MLIFQHLENDRSPTSPLVTFNMSLANMKMSLFLHNGRTIVGEEVGTKIGDIRVIIFFKEYV